MGPYVSGYLNTYGRNKDNLNYVRSLLFHLESHLKVAGLGSISEVFDGDPPHRPSGCFAQAWSVAELLRIYKEEF
jgi:glycogen debranching enzyme